MFGVRITHSILLLVSAIWLCEPFCTEMGGVAIFMVYQQENPDKVFSADDGCLAGGGRGGGCCAGSACVNCQLQQVNSTSGNLMVWYTCPCDPCTPGSVQPQEGERSCIACPKGWYTEEAGLQECKQCPAGTFNPKQGLDYPCDPCPPGTYSESRMEDFREATSQALAGSSAIFDAAKGAYFCTDCPAGTYQPAYGATSIDACQLCPVGYYSGEGSPQCSACPKLTFNQYEGMDSIDDCLACPAGTCNDSVGQGSCYQCCPIYNVDCGMDMQADGPGVYINEPHTYKRYDVPRDQILEYRRAQCKYMCESLGVNNWCTGVDVGKGEGQCA